MDLIRFGLSGKEFDAVLRGVGGIDNLIDWDGKSQEITIMKYIGATDFFVRAPFVVEGLLIGLIGSGIPIGLIYILYNYGIEFIMMNFGVLTDILAFLPVAEILNYLVPISLGIGAGIGFLGSFTTVRKHLRV